MSAKRCECGCGTDTPRATYTARHAGIERGKPLRFVPGHQNRKSPVDYIEEDRGFDTPCWAWQLSKSTLGYGVTRRGAPDGKGAQAAHRFYYAMHVGPLTSEVDLHHRCGQRDCVNPAHLEPMTTGAHLRQHSQLTPEVVAEIRRRYVPRKVTRAMLADEFGTSTRNIKHIIAGTTWQEVAA